MSDKYSSRERAQRAYFLKAFAIFAAATAFTIHQNPVILRAFDPTETQRLYFFIGLGFASPFAFQGLWLFSHWSRSSDLHRLLLHLVMIAWLVGGAFLLGSVYLGTEKANILLLCATIGAAACLVPVLRHALNLRGRSSRERKSPSVSALCEDKGGEVVAAP